MYTYEIHGFNYHYIINPEKGDTVSYGDAAYRVHDDGKGWLHIIVQKDGIRKKIGIDKVIECGIIPGSEADWVLNEWWKLYDFVTFTSFVAAELSWLKN